MKLLFAIHDLTIKEAAPGQFGVFSSDQPLSWFTTYNDAHRLLQDVYISRKEAQDDPIVGTVKFFPHDLGGGGLAVVVAKVKGGYLVQPQGSTERFTVAADILSEPPTIP